MTNGSSARARRRAPRRRACPRRPRNASSPARVTADIVMRIGIVQLRRRDVGLAPDHEPRALEQLGPVPLELVEQDALLLLGRAPVDAGEVEQQHEHARAFDVAEEGVPEAAALGRALDEAGDVGEHELVVVEAHDAEVRLERGERVVGDLGLRRAHRRDQRGLPGVREADERGVGEQLHLEAEPALLAVLALLGEAGRAASVRQEARVAPPAAAAARGEVRSPWCTRSASSSPSRARTIVPSGTATTRSSPLAPCCFLPAPCLPDGARRCGWSRNASSDATLRSARKYDVAARAAVAAARARPWACAPRAGTTPRPRRRRRRARSPGPRRRSCPAQVKDTDSRLAPPASTSAAQLRVERPIDAGSCWTPGAGRMSTSLRPLR